MMRSGLAATSLLVSLAAGTALAAPPMSIDEDASPVVLERPRVDKLPTVLDAETFAIATSPVVNTNKVYLNNCKPNGCIIRSGNGSSLDGSGYQGTWPINGTRTLAAFNQSDAIWNQVVACVKDVFSPYGVEILTTNPSPNPHFEIMIAGKSTELGLSSQTLGIALYQCGTEYIPNALVYAFANSPSYVGDVEQICATAAQELAHSFNLDHVVDPSDPLTYFSYNGRRRFKNAPVNCGSDCVAGKSPSGRTCTGGNSQTHICECSNQATQNSHAAITALFGNGTPTPPTVKITNLVLGQAVGQGFPIVATAEDDNGVASVQAFVDGNTAGLLTTQPYAFNAPATLADGTHTVRVVATDIYGTSAESLLQVVLGEKCEKPADCPQETDTCIGGRCVPGPGAQGGLGATCMSGPDCASGQCAQDASGARYCVEPCTLDAGECPSGFGCLAAGDGGICWPGFDEGGGGCQSGQPAAPIGMGLALGAILLARRKRRS